MVKDPICDMDVDPKLAKFKTSYKDKTYFFCSEFCKKSFDKNPGNYASK
jgi:YHS domain-containing protein